MNYLRSNIDLKYTEPHYSARILKAFIDYLNEYHGVEYTKRLLYEAGIDYEYAKNENNWVSEAFFEQFYELLDQDPKLPSDWGYQIQRNSNHPKHLTILHRTFALVLSTRKLYQMVSKLTPKFNKVDFFKLVKTAPNRFEGRFKSKRKTKYIQQIVDGWRGHLETIPCILNELQSVVEVREEGDEYIFDIKIQPKQSKRFLLFFTLLHFVSFAVVTFLTFKESFLQLTLLSTMFYVLLASLSGNLIVFFQKMFASHKDTISSLKENIEDYEKRYMELYESKKRIALKNLHTQVLKRVSTFALKTLKLDHLLKFMLKQTIHHLNYSRALVMLIDEQSGLMEVAASIGFGKSLEQALLSQLKLQVDSDKKDPLLFHNLIYQKEPVVIHDVDTYKKKLLPQNREMLDFLQVEQFIVAPLFDGGKRYGLVVVDRSKESGKLTEDDIRTIHGISNQLSISISHFYTQRNLNRTQHNLRDSLDTTKKIAQFVPKQLVRSIKSTTWEELYKTYNFSNSTVAFVDIAGYSTLSEAFTPLDNVEFLNQIFMLIDPIVEKYDGDIDKRMGDCAMMVFPMEKHHTWEQRSSWRAVQCLWEVQQALNKFEFNGKNMSVKKINFHIGAATGPLIHANIGSPHRLEHTVLGDTVNVASRLEELSQNNIIINETMLTEIQNDVDTRKLPDVVLRNKSLKVNVYEVLNICHPTKQKTPSKLVA